MTVREQPVSTVPDLPADPPAEPAAPPVRLSAGETLRVLGTVLLPILAAGVIKRRPALLGLAARLGADRGAIGTLAALRERHGSGPVRLRIPGRSVQLPLDPADVGRILAGTPDPFSPATLEKRAALGHFQPHGVLISTGAERAVRRVLNDEVLDADRPLHHLAPRIVTVAREETHRLLDTAGLSGTMDWDRFAAHWWAIARRTVLGDAAREDHELTDLLGSLRLTANWAYLAPRRRGARDALLRGVNRYVERAEPGSLAAEVAGAAAPDDADGPGQIPHWLFAFDAAGMTTARTLALLAAHDDVRQAVRAELAGQDLTQPRQLPLLRACVLEAVRLWPTTPAVLRESTRETGYGRAGTTELVFTPFFHRDPATVPVADEFAPRIWLDGTARRHPALVPFSGGPGQCPGRNLVLLTATTVLAALLEHHDFALAGRPALRPGRPLPATLNNFGLAFTVRRIDSVPED